MLISEGNTRALETIAQRQRDALEMFSPGAVAERSDVASAPSREFTLDPLSVTAPEQSYFVTAGDRGERLYSRDGRFHFRDGTLVDFGGREVLGFTGDGRQASALHADPADVALGAFSQPSIDERGRVSYERNTIDPDNGGVHRERVTIGTLALARFPAATRLQQFDPQHGSAPAGVAPHVGCAGDGSFGALAPMTQERSGISIDRSLQRLQEAYIAFDALRAAGKAQGGVEKTTMDLLK